MNDEAYIRTGYRIRLAKFDEDREFPDGRFWTAINEEIVGVGKEDFKNLFETIKSRIKTNIDQDRKSTVLPGPDGYITGSLAKSVRYRIREYKSGKGVSLRGFFTVGDGLPYAGVHDKEGSTTITPVDAPFLVFFNHVTGQWVKTKSVNRPGSPFFDDAVQYGLSKLYS